MRQNLIITITYLLEIRNNVLKLKWVHVYLLHNPAYKKLLWSLIEPQTPRHNQLGVRALIILWWMWAITDRFIGLRRKHGDLSDITYSHSCPNLTQIYLSNEYIVFCCISMAVILRQYGLWFFLFWELNRWVFNK